MRVPRYFFHVQDGSDFVDGDGTEFSGVEEARTQSVRAAGEALRDHASKFWYTGEWFMNVVDESGANVCCLRFSAEHPRD